MKKTKKDIYKEFGIEFQDGKILAPEFGLINPLLINGNAKLGKGVYTFSILAGNALKTYTINGKEYELLATCPCNCPGCYAQNGCYRFPSCKESLARKTFLVRNFPEFVRNAIIAQIKADKIKLCRIHAAGDFYGLEYVKVWKDICAACPDCVFWGYTKFQAAEKAFQAVPNCNIVKSVLPGGTGFNFGTCEYILRAYAALKEAGKAVYICRCGIDKMQHCSNCKGCSKNEFVLFIEHGTAYDPASDPLFPVLRDIIEKQARPE